MKFSEMCVNVFQNLRTLFKFILMRLRNWSFFFVFCKIYFYIYSLQLLWVKFNEIKVCSCSICKRELVSLCEIIFNEYIRNFMSSTFKNIVTQAIPIYSRNFQLSLDICQKVCNISYLLEFIEIGNFTSNLFYKIHYYISYTPPLYVYQIRKWN